MVHGRKPIRRLDADERVASDSGGDGEAGALNAGLEISLEDLGNAFADALRVDHPKLHQDPELSMVANDHLQSDHLQSDGALVTPNAILEAVLFVGTRSGEPVGLGAMMQVLRDFSEEEIVAHIAELNQEYHLNGHAIRIVSQEPGYVMRLAEGLEDIHNVIASNVRETQLNQNGIDCLALVAYQPGITKAAIELQWGQPAGQVLAHLVRKGLLRMDSEQGETGIDGDQHNKRYFTTERFLAILGVDSLDDLPRGDEL